MFGSPVYQPKLYALPQLPAPAAVAVKKVEKVSGPIQRQVPSEYASVPPHQIPGLVGFAARIACHAVADSLVEAIVARYPCVQIGRAHV